MKIVPKFLLLSFFTTVRLFSSQTIATAAFFQGLGDLPDGLIGNAASGVSTVDSTVVGVSNSTHNVFIYLNEAFSWHQNDDMMELRDIPGGLFGSRTNALSEDGSIIVRPSISSNSQEAFIRDKANRMQSGQDALENDFALDLTGWRSSNTSGISADSSVILGTGINSDAKTEAWIADNYCDGNTRYAGILFGWEQNNLQVRLEEKRSSIFCLGLQSASSGVPKWKELFLSAAQSLKEIAATHALQEPNLTSSTAFIPYLLVPQIKQIDYKRNNSQIKTKWSSETRINSRGWKEGNPNSLKPCYKYWKSSNSKFAECLQSSKLNLLKR